MQNKPTIAVLMATYNGEMFLKQQLDSILSQTYQNFKIYVSDDLSNDGTLEIIKKYQQNFPEKIFYTVNEVNIGYVENFEKLLKNSSEPYLALSDQDDIWEQHKLELLVENMLCIEAHNKQTPILVHSDLSMIDEDGKLFRSSYFDYRGYKLKEEKDLGHILGPCGVMGNTLLINDKLKKLVLPFPKMLDVHDYWIAVNAELFGKRKTLFKPLVQYRIHKSNVSNSHKHLKKQTVAFFSRDIKLPNMQTNRKLFLLFLFEKVQNVDDMRVLKAYMKYLQLKGNRIRIYINLLKYALVKRDWLFRAKLFLKILVTNRYDV